MSRISNSITLQHKLSSFFGVSLQIIVTIFLSRLMVDTGVRMVYPFIPQISEGLGLTIVGFSWLIFIRAMAGITGPILGWLADRYGRRKIMAIGLVCQSLGVVGVALSWQWYALIPMILHGLTVSAFMPAEQAYISDQAAFEKRGRALGAIELSWALAGVVSLPVVGWMIDAFGWRSPFFLLSIVSLIGAVFIWTRLPAAEHRVAAGLGRTKTWQVWVRPNVLASMGVGLLLFVGVGCFITIWGIWLSADFGLDAAALGLVATAIGLAELSGSGASSLFIDRVGKRRGSQVGLLLSAAAFLLLPFSGGALATSVAGLVLLGVCIEFTIVSLLPLYAEQAPEARATVFALVGFGISIGVACGSPITAALWERSGLWAVSAVAAAAILAALFLTTRFLHD